VIGIDRTYEDVRRRIDVHAAGGAQFAVLAASLAIARRSGVAMTVLVRAEFRVTADRDEFLRLASELAVAAGSEAGTVRYCWFSSADSSTFVVIEEYDDEAAALTHNQACSALLGQIAEVSEMTRVDLHGAIGPDLQQWIEQHPQASAFAPLSR
jgi:quinol monooxygenase YgiN